MRPGRLLFSMRKSDAPCDSPDSRNRPPPECHRNDQMRSDLPAASIQKFVVQVCLPTLLFDIATHSLHQIAASSLPQTPPKYWTYAKIEMILPMTISKIIWFWCCTSIQSKSDESTWDQNFDPQTVHDTCSKFCTDSPLPILWPNSRAPAYANGIFQINYQLRKSAFRWIFSKVPEV